MIPPTFNAYNTYKILMDDPDVQESIKKDRERKAAYKEYYKSNKPKGIIEYIKYILSQI